MKDYWYRLGAYYGILTHLMFVSQVIEINEDPQDTSDWVPINENQDTLDYDDSWR